jgi:hypothetical protein
MSTPKAFASWQFDECWRHTYRTMQERLYWMYGDIIITSRLPPIGSDQGWKKDRTWLHDFIHQLFIWIEGGITFNDAEHRIHTRPGVIGGNYNTIRKLLWGLKLCLIHNQLLYPPNCSLYSNNSTGCFINKWFGYKTFMFRSISSWAYSKH